ncbi:MAG: hypothetical protein OHK0032_12130 [Thermodesulfovibrionales bacterium]
MRVVCLISGFILLLVLQTKITIFGIAPDLTAAVAYYLGINNGSNRGALLGSIIGIIEDSIGGGMLGPNLLGKGMVGFFSSFVSGRPFRWTPLLGMVSIFILTIADSFVVYLSRVVFETTPAPLSAAIPALLIQGLINSTIGAFLRPKNAD